MWVSWKPSNGLLRIRNADEANEILCHKFDFRKYLKQKGKFVPLQRMYFHADFGWIVWCLQGRPQEFGRRSLPKCCNRALLGSWSCQLEVTNHHIAAAVYIFKDKQTLENNSISKKEWIQSAWKIPFDFEITVFPIPYTSFGAYLKI